METDKDKSPVIVSACLVGLPTRYDNTDALCTGAVERLEGRAFIPVCPEQLGGLPTPRPRATISSGSGADVLKGNAQVIDSNGADVTSQFVAGAQGVLKIARLCNAKEAYLKEKSPSCGVHSIYVKDQLSKGKGVTAVLLESNGIIVTGF